MKLLMCRKCGDIFSLRHAGEDRRCLCGAVAGRYTSDGLMAEYEGPGVPLAIANNSLSHTIRMADSDAKLKRQRQLGFKLDAWIIPWSSDHMRLREDKR